MFVKNIYYNDIPPPHHHSPSLACHNMLTYAADLPQSYNRDLPRIAPVPLFPSFPTHVFICLGPWRTCAKHSIISNTTVQSIPRDQIRAEKSFSRNFLEGERERKNSTTSYGELNMRILWTIILLCLVAVIVAVYAKPMIYKKNEDNVFEPGEQTVCYLFECIAKN